MTAPAMRPENDTGPRLPGDERRARASEVLAHDCRAPAGSDRVAATNA